MEILKDEINKSKILINFIKLIGLHNSNYDYNPSLVLKCFFITWMIPNDEYTENGFF